MPKTTPDAIERDARESITAFHQRALDLKAQHRQIRQEIRDDPRRSDEAKRDDLAALQTATRTALDGIKGEQQTYLGDLRSKLERDLLGNQPSDPASVVSRRDAADRARRLSDEREGISMLRDAARLGDETLVNAIGYQARQQGWTDALDAYREVRPSDADQAASLAVAENLSTDKGLNLASQIAYSDPD